MTHYRTSGRSYVRAGVAIGCLALLIAAVQPGCSRYDKFDEVETKAVIEEVTGCEVPGQPSEMRGLSYEHRGQTIYAAFRIPPEASSELSAAFQCEGVEILALPHPYAVGFSVGCTYEGEAGVDLFDPTLLQLATAGEVQVTGPVRFLSFRGSLPQAPNSWWGILIFEDTGIVYFAAVLNP